MKQRNFDFRNGLLPSLPMLAILIALAFNAHGQTLTKPYAQTKKKSEFFKPYGKGFVFSSAAYWGGTAFDLTRTRSCLAARTCQEGNPFLRAPNGSVRTGRVLGFAAGFYGVSLLLEKRHPKLASVVRFSWGGGHFLAASRRW